jgi:phytanoyl-CoA hydroxylase
MRTLTAEELERFREEGFVVLANVLPPRRLALLRSAVDKMDAHRQAYQAQHPDLVSAMREAEAKGEVIHATEWTHVVMQMYQLWERLPAMRQHSLDPILGELARTALGVPGLRLWFDQAMIKPPGGGPTPFHQDNAYLPVDAGSGGVITIWCPLTAVTAEMGCLRYVTASHRWPELPPISLTGLDDVRPLLPDPGSLDEAVPAEISEGGAVIHHGNVLHGAGPNTTEHPRAAVLTCYYADGARRVGGQRQYVIDRDGVTEGEVLVGPGLPLVAGRSPRSSPQVAQ